ncbi:hypothetical protein GKC30_07790 [Pseudodesulfovibrio sp. F-1]|uniref:Sulfotransferase n=1 Tax=Pseudodesulfovibrio alkaliphilus TaxID=2661613 RepID=A0A7K1KN89_9BACT|nr:hypothetical protein [Pseudodesulfovibrio alkaliphilus]MUM77529.1 hypothetical protein [Pseudodesulfovibrio alkaliphilus]
MKYYLHVGLHKTATKFFQHRVFPFLPGERINYNPAKLTQLVCDLMKAAPEDVDMVIDAIAAEKAKLQRESRDVLMSREIMSGDLFSFYKDYEETISRLSRAFEEAEILLAFRFQPEWIVSCYRETVHEHHFQTLSEFLNTSPGIADNGFAHADYRTLDWTGILRTYCERFGSRHVHVSFFERFTADKVGAVREMYSVLGLEGEPEIRDQGTIPNRGYSALAINLSLWRYRMLRKLGLEKRLVHRPIFFFGEDGIPAGFEELSSLPVEPYWGERFLRDGEEIRPAGYPKLSFADSIRMSLSWRSLMKRGLDRIAYFDGDVCKEKRRELEAYFHHDNKRFQEYARTLGVDVPKQYLGAT